MKKIALMFALFMCFTPVKYQNIEYTPILQRQGCCSWHGGVCGCSRGRALCCDGTLSPSCGC